MLLFLNKNELDFLLKRCHSFIIWVKEIAAQMKVCNRVHFYKK